MKGGDKVAKTNIYFLSKDETGKVDIFWTEPGSKWKPEVGRKIPAKIGEGWVAWVLGPETCNFIRTFDALIDSCTTSRGGGDIFQHIEALFRAGLQAAKFEIPKSRRSKSKRGH